MHKQKNNAYGTLAGSITDVATSITLTTGHGARFPATSSEDYFYATLMDNSGNLEIIKVTSRSTDVLTVVRGLDGTTARAYTTGDRLELRPTNVMLEALRQESSQWTAAGGTDNYTLTLDPAPHAYSTSQLYRVKFGAANTTSTPTLNVNSLGAKNIKLPGSAAIGPGQIIANMYGLLVYDGTDMILLNPYNGIPAGVELNFMGSAVPTGYLACDGSNVSRTTYAALFAAIGTTWGVGDGSSTFTLPDSRRRVAVGSGGAGTGTLGNAVGNTGGAETHTLVTGEIPAHGHEVTINTSNNNSSGSTTSNVVWEIVDNPTSSTVVVTSANAGGGGAHNNMQPSYVVTKIIKV